MSVITVQNKGQEVVSSNYWQSEYDRAGAVFLSVNAGAIRLLLPHGAIGKEIEELQKVSEVIVSRGPWTEQGRDTAIEILFEDGSDSPFVIHLGVEQVDRLIPASESGKDLVFTVWKQGPVCVAKYPGLFRAVSRIPCMKKWGEE